MRWTISFFSCSKSVTDSGAYSTMPRCWMLKGNLSLCWVEQIITTSLPDANANPSSYITFGFCVVMSAKHIEADRISSCNVSTGMTARSSLSTRYGSSPASLIAGAIVSSYLFKVDPFVKTKISFE